MTNLPIEAIIFDVGGTLRRTEKRPQAEKPAYIKKICELLGSDLPAEEMLAMLEQRASAYKEWSIQTTIGLSEADLWSQWMLPEWPVAAIRKLAIQLNQTWREALGVRKVLPEVRGLMLELFRRGYHLGIASNTITSTEVPQMLKDLELAGYFECAVLSCTIKSRKPEPELLLAAAAEMGLAPEVCVYVGNRADLDVPAARRAGFQQVILIGDPALPAVDLPAADAYISNLNELLDLFSTRRSQGSTAGSAAYPPAIHASLSTMWAMKNFDHLNDFYETALRMGYSRIELNHQVTPEMLAGFDMLPGRVSSVHEPCPAVISAHTLTDNDWLISSPDEANRARGVASVKRSIELAHQLQARVVVVHCGNVHRDHSLEKKLAALYSMGQKKTPAYEKLRQAMLSVRCKLVEARLSAVKTSLLELIEFATPLGICLGLENRYHFMDIPAPDEMETLLSLGRPEQLGFVLDTGHAVAMDRLGFYPQDQWLARFGVRLVGMHLHDVAGVVDHQSPGSADVDFSLFQHSMPNFGFQTLELAPHQTFLQVKNGLKYLLQKGMLHSL